MQHYDYLIWVMSLALIPTTIVWLFYWRILVKYIRVFMLCIVGSMIFAIPWDYWATHSWLWHFSPEKTLGVSFLGLPLEEYVFFASFTVLYASIALVLRQSLFKDGRGRRI